MLCTVWIQDYSWLLLVLWPINLQYFRLTYTIDSILRPSKKFPGDFEMYCMVAMANSFCRATVMMLTVPGFTKHLKVLGLNSVFL